MKSPISFRIYAAITILIMASILSLLVLVGGTNAQKFSAGKSSIAQQSTSASVFTDTAANQVTYTVVDLGVLPGSIGSSATSINDNGQAVGYSYFVNAPQYRAVLFSGGNVRDLGIPCTGVCAAQGINNKGQIVGFYQVSGQGTRAFLYDETNGMKDLGRLGTVQTSLAYGINDEGKVVGESYLTLQWGHAFLYSGSMQDLGTLPDYQSSEASSINKFNQVVGICNGGPNRNTVFLYNGGMIDLGSPFPGKELLGVVINDSGQVAGGGYIDSQNQQPHAVFYSNGTWKDLGKAGVNSYAVGINNNGQVVGQSNGRAFLYQNGVMSDLNSLISDNSGSGWVLESAGDLNDAGQIVGSGRHNGQSRAFLLNPTCSTPSITVQPLNATILGGQTATLTVTANGSAPLNYQWYKVTGDTTEPIAGATLDTFTTPPLTITTRYLVKVTNTCVSISSLTSTVTVSCTVQINPRWVQFQSPWEKDDYDSIPKKIKSKGCGITSLAMALKHRGVDTDPGRLNELMKQHSGATDPTPDFDKSGNVMWENTVRDIAPSLRFNYFVSTSTQQVEARLCQGQPVIVKVLRNGGPHFVLVTGKQGNQFLIADPASSAPNSTLDVYNNVFETRGSVVPAAVGGSNLSLTSFVPTTIAGTNDSSMNVLVEGTATALVVDQLGRRTGFDVATNSVLLEIPGSVYFSDSIGDDETGEPGGSNHTIHIDQPIEGTYRIDVIGQGSGNYTLRTSSFSQDGTPQAAFFGAGSINDNAIIPYTVKYSPTPSTVELLLENSPSPLQVTALDSMLFLRDPFPIINIVNRLNRGSDDLNTRVIIFVSNLQLARSENVVVSLTGSNNQNFEVVAEDVRPVSNFQLTQVTFRLPDHLAPGTCTVGVRAHNQISNAGTIRIQP